MSSKNQFEILFFRYAFGPLNATICFIELVIKNSIVTQMMLFLDGIIIGRYVFIFWLKNPMAFNDEFWDQFISIWIVSFASISQFIFVFMPGIISYANTYLLKVLR
jgi:hypothetical protein